MRNRLYGRLKALQPNSTPPCPQTLDSPLRYRQAHNSCDAIASDHPAMRKPAPDDHCRYSYLLSQKGANRELQAVVCSLASPDLDTPASQAAWQWSAAPLFEN